MAPTFIPPLHPERVLYRSELKVLEALEPLSDQWRIYPGRLERYIPKLPEDGPRWELEISD